jgi:hypothetical protein
MRTNREVTEAFVLRKASANANMTSTGDRLFSYHTCIAESFLNKYNEICFVVNDTRYSNTTTRHRNYLYDELNKLLFKGFIVVVKRVDNVPIGTQSLKQYYNDI